MARTLVPGKKRYLVERGKLYAELQFGRRLWMERYIGPETYAGPDEKFYKVKSGWWFLRGDGAIISREFFRLGMGKTYFIFRFRPFIFKIHRYNRKYAFDLRWN